VVIALGSASEVRYMLSVARRLGMLDDATASSLEGRYDELVRGLQGLVTALDEDT
jgi:four helix bundle protein